MVMIRRADGHEIDSSTQRLDGELVHHWLSTDAYWALGRHADVVSRSLANSVCFGVYAPDGRQAGIARIVTDHATFAWLCDVYLAPESRGLGLGTWLAQTVVDQLSAAGVPRIILATRDAHTVYEKAGFVTLAEPERWMEIDRRGTGYGRRHQGVGAREVPDS